LFHLVLHLRLDAGNAGFDGGVHCVLNLRPDGSQLLLNSGGHLCPNRSRVGIENLGDLAVDFCGNPCTACAAAGVRYKTGADVVNKEKQQRFVAGLETVSSEDYPARRQ